MSRLSLLPTFLVLAHLFSYVSAGNSYLSRSDSDLSITGHKRSSSKTHKRISRNESAYLNSLNAERKREDAGTYLGCYYDSSSSRVLSVGPHTLSSSLTTATCVQYCESAGYDYAGTEYGQECWCGGISSSAVAASASYCSYPCSGNCKIMFCSGPYRRTICL